jgi:glutamate 5-kinase
MAITRGRQPSNILKIMAGEAIGTRFEAQKRSDNARKRWIAYGLLPMGKIYLDAGAIQAICQGKISPSSRDYQSGREFSASESVQLCDREG